ncbi:MAG: hypothetical protein H6672_11080 [Anaerolineaceae bacterium]|nr:hypothetical protein [Anaerolineaceae bacterium]
MPNFQYTPPITATFPTVIGGVFIGSVKNAPSSDLLLKIYQHEQQEIKQAIGDTPLSDLPSLNAWRSAFRAFNVDPTKYRSASEALLRRLTKKGDIPSVNTLVDIGNLVSIRYGLPVAIFDVGTLVGDTLSVQFASGEEEFWPLGVDEYEHPAPGEVIFADAARNVYARRWCWRQSRDSAAHAETTQVIVTVEAHHTDALKTIESAVKDLEQFLREHAAFRGKAGVISAEQPIFSA